MKFIYWTSPILAQIIQFFIIASGLLFINHNHDVKAVILMPFLLSVIIPPLLLIPIFNTLSGYIYIMYLAKHKNHMAKILATRLLWLSWAIIFIIVYVTIPTPTSWVVGFFISIIVYLLPLTIIGSTLHQYKAI